MIENNRIPLDFERDLADDLPLLPEELKLVQYMLHELLKEMAWQQTGSTKCVPTPLATPRRC